MQPGSGQQSHDDPDYRHYDQYAAPPPAPEAASDYYHQQPLPHHYSQQTYYQPSHPPAPIAQFQYAEATSLERKPAAGFQQTSAYRFQSPTELQQPHPEPPTQGERTCDVCQSLDPILVAPTCGHTFHSRCVHIWPLDACPVCATPLEQLAISGSVNMMVKPDARSGKWTRAEEKFIDAILREFDRQALPLAHGTPVRLVLAKLLNCSTMRLSKKFQKNALGKRTFRVSKPARGDKALQFDQADHARRQHEFSRLEQVFRQELVDQFRRENNTDDGALVETQDLRCAVQQFWVSNFLKFAVLVGQPVLGLDVSDAKKRKRAMQLLRNGQYDELLTWHQHPSPANTASISPMPPAVAGAAAAAGDDVVPGPWATGAAVYASPGMGQVHHESGPIIHQLLQQADQPGQQQLRPMKKMRMPEGGVDVSRYGIQPPPMDSTGAAYPHYGRLSPPAAPYEYTQQQQQQQQQYPSEHFVRQSSAGYSPYSHMKAEKPMMGYANVLQQQQQQMASTLAEQESQQRGALAPASYHRAGGAYHPGAGEAAAVGQAPSPWDELLENMSASAANASAGAPDAPGAASSESGSAQSGGDPSLQAWSNLHIL
ncbi:hypothetical protein BBJ28_00021886 [Nothophytophthora sp. Chile5]|nr:hypothetical protein BBJ28_00021886 [Nothophytophthora sp. Chile5]